MNKTPITSTLSKDEKKFLASITATSFSITLQDKRRKDSETVYTVYPINKEMYDYYFIHFIRLWGKKINFESLDGITANGFLDALNSK